MDVVRFVGLSLLITLLCVTAPLLLIGSWYGKVHEFPMVCCVFLLLLMMIHLANVDLLGGTWRRMLTFTVLTTVITAAWSSGGSFVWLATGLAFGSNLLVGLLMRTILFMDTRKLPVAR